MKKCLVSVLVLIFIVSGGKAQSPVLYGLTQNGGDNNAGTLFRYNVTTGTDTVLHSFGTGTDGANPTGSVLLCSNGLLYGLTTTGGANNKGIIFTYNIGTGLYRDVHDFGSGTDAQTPHGSLVEVIDTLLYGMSESGGVNSGGTIFTYNFFTDSEAVVYNLGTYQDGELPYGSLINENDSLLYGLTLRGGAAGGAGSIIDYNIIENSDTVLYSFGANDTDSQNPYGSLFQSSSNGWFYGSTYYGGKYNNGSIFAFYYSDTLFTDALLYSFGNGTDGQNPHGSFIQVGDSLYGTTLNGGSNDSGTVISFGISTKRETVLHSFAGGADGSQPYGSLIKASNQLLYGMTQNGGTNAKGTIFSFNTTNGTETAVYSFGSGNDGAMPQGDLIEVDGAPSVTGIEQVAQAAEKLSVFPNPSSGKFTVSLTGNQNTYPVEIYDMLGNKIYSAILSASQNTINLNNQPAGMYFVHVLLNDGVVTGKVMVAK